MFIGHIAAAFAAKRSARSVSLGWLVAAAQLPDLIWPVLLLTGTERARVAPGVTEFTPLAFDHYPWSHSLLMVVVWGVVLAAVYRVRRKDARGAAVLAALVISHWVLDWITHIPDLPLVPGGGPKLGLGLWNSMVATLVVELVFFAVGAWIYMRTTSARDRVGRWAWFGYLAFLLVIHAGNAFGPPPPNMNAVAIGGFAIWLLVLWAGWVDRHREAVPGA